MYLSSKEIREFEDKVGWDNVVANNEFIGKLLGFQPRVEYAVCANGACCYSPKNVSSYYSDPDSQKRECDRFLEDQKKRFPNGWVENEGYKTTKLEFYPQFHLDWNHLIEAMNRLYDYEKPTATQINHDIFATWENVVENCKQVEREKAKLMKPSTYILTAIPEAKPAIRCLICGKFSFNPNDIANRYCGNCNIFHHGTTENIEDGKSI